MTHHDCVRSRPARKVLALFSLVLLSACATTAPPQPAPASAAPAQPANNDATALLDRLRALCGKAYAGRVIIDTPESADNPFAGKPLVMHVRDCGADSVRVPFHVGDDRSRTWVFERQGDGLRFKHDHRHRDGSQDALTWYGGELRPSTRAGRYEFPADEETKTLFRRQNREAAIQNTWAVEIDAQRFVYELERPGRLFRAEFDLSKPIPAPPPPWGG